MTQEEKNVEKKKIMSKEINFGTPMKITGPCGKEITVNVLFGSAACSKCGDMCRFDFIKNIDNNGKRNYKNNYT